MKNTRWLVVARPQGRILAVRDLLGSAERVAELWRERSPGIVIEVVARV